MIIFNTDTEARTWRFTVWFYSTVAFVIVAILSFLLGFQFLVGYILSVTAFSIPIIVGMCYHLLFNNDAP